MMDNNIIQIFRLTLDEIEELHKIIKEKDKKIQALTDELETMKHNRTKSWDLGPGVSFGSNTGLSSLVSFGSNPGLSSLETSVSTTKNTS